MKPVPPPARRPILDTAGAGGRAPGFFRFPARVTTRVAVLPIHVVRAGAAANQPARAAFRIRQGLAADAVGQTPPVNQAPADRGAAPRVTLRV